MSTRNLSCPGCRIRVRASAPATGLPEIDCPTCGAKLRSVSSASSVVGFPLFDFGALAEQHGSGPLPAHAEPVDLFVRREAASARGEVVGEPWPDEGARVNSRAVAQWLATH